jgi:cytochrome c
MTRPRRLAALVVIGVAAACGGGTAPPADIRYGFGHAATPGDIAKEDIDVGPDGVGLPPGHGTAAQGAPIFAAKCSACHGPAGEGTPLAMALVGRIAGDSFNFADAQANEGRKTVGSWWPYATTLYDYIHRAMPFDRPGSLAPDEVYSLVAFVLAKNEIIAGDAVMDAKTLPSVQMPAHARFVRDDRETSTHAR